MLQIIKKPVVTEKAMKGSTASQYVFEVDPNSNKIEIKKAIEEMFEVNIVSIRTARIKGKVKKRFTRSGLQVGKTKLRKKAFVTLKEGESIEFVSGAQA